MTRHLFDVGGLRFANPPYTFPTHRIRRVG